MTWKNYAALYPSLEAAREAFESDCSILFKNIYPITKSRRVEVKTGDEGVDIFIGGMGLEPITIIQCKFFIEGFGESQKSNIRSSFKKVAVSKKFSVKEWILCIPRRLTIDENLWWEKWKETTATKYGINRNSIILYDGDTLIELLKEKGLYNRVFKITDKILLEEILNKVETIAKDSTINIDISFLKKLFRSASFDLNSSQGNFGASITHIQRKETSQIVAWVKRDLLENEKRLLVLEGEKGFGKTIILRDVLKELTAEGIIVLAIKADKIYSRSRTELERMLFQRDNLTFEDLLDFFKKNNQRFVVIIDQLDALSQTLSSNREYLQTYNRLIADLAEIQNCKIIISARTFDLNYDAALSIYKREGHTNIKVDKLDLEQVKYVLKKYGIIEYSQKFLDLLRIPNQLDIFCRLPYKELANYSSLSSLKDLYDVLWKQIVSNDNGWLSKIMYMIAEKMYNQQQIMVKNIYTHQTAEINYLVSNGLLVENNGYLQFFHQTFYDYTFSRQFVERGLSLSVYIIQNKQSLYCRAVIKMVLDYYRDFDVVMYNKKIIELLKPRYRYHIRSLVINNLAHIEYPTIFEKNIFFEKIVKDRHHIENFINSISSTGWMEFLLREDIPYQLLTSSGKFTQQKIHPMLQTFIKPYICKDTVPWILRLFWANSATSLDQIINYIKNRLFSQEHQDLVNRFLTMHQDWQNVNLLPLFEQYVVFDIQANRHSNFYYFHALEKIYVHYPEYVLKQLKLKIIAIIEDDQEMPYELKKLLEKMAKDNSGQAALYFIDILLPIAERPTVSSRATSSNLYNSYFFSEYKSLSRRSASSELLKIIEKALSYQIKNTAFITMLFHRIKNNNSRTVLKLLCETLRKASKLYKDEILELILLIHSKRGFDDIDDKFQYSIRKLIAKSFKFLSQEQRDVVSKIVLDVRHTYEKDIYTDHAGCRRHRLHLYGKKQYLFLDALPTKLRNKNIQLKKAHQELRRKFGKITEKHLDVSGVIWGSSRPPLSQSSYERLDNAAWIETMLKYNDEYREPFDSGGKLEHKRAFTELVARTPEKFITLIWELFSTEGISHDYIHAGIEGLIKSKYDTNKVLPLYHRFIALQLNTVNTIGAIHQADYFIQSECADKPVIDFLSRLALTHSHPETIHNPDHLFSDAINSVRGGAVYALVRCYYNKAYADKIFSTLNKAAEDSLSIVRIGMLTNIAYLNNLDIKRSFDLFLKLTSTDDLDILSHAFWSAGYYRANYYKQLKPLIQKVILNEKLHENGAIFIVHNWLLGYDKNGRDYKKLIQRSKIAKLKAIHIAEENLFTKEQPDQKCLNILMQLLNEKDEDFVHPYSTFVLRKCNVYNFKSLYQFLNSYTKTSLFLEDPAYTIQYLTKVAKQYPLECLQLLSNIDFSKKPDMQKRGFYKDEPVQLVLAIYSYLCVETPYDKKQIANALKIFDDMLKLDHLRLASNNALDTIQL